MLGRQADAIHHWFDAFGQGHEGLVVVDETDGLALLLTGR
jgi:hypothetical protein